MSRREARRRALGLARDVLSAWLENDGLDLGDCSEADAEKVRLEYGNVIEALERQLRRYKQDNK